MQAEIVEPDRLTQLGMEAELDALIAALGTLPRWRRGGFVTGCSVRTVTATCLAGEVGVGDLCLVETTASPTAAAALARPGPCIAEVVGFDAAGVRLVPYGGAGGIHRGARIAVADGLDALRPSLHWRGRVIDAMGGPLDGGPPLPQGPTPYPIHARGVPAETRRGLGARLTLGVRALDLFAPCREGQRMGIFSGSGVGKSTLLSMIAAGTDADALVIGLIGERGRELHDVLEHTLRGERRAPSAIAGAASDLPAMLRRRAAYVTLTIAEYLRDQGLKVLCLMDSVTRFAMALREICLAAGEVPTSRGYPPGVFAELPCLLERAGPGAGAGSITGLFSVLVEGDDVNEPVSDTVRGILDGHVVLDRAVAERGRFPAVDPLRSLSRAAPGCYAADEAALVGEARRLLRLHADMAELVRLGAYRPGSDPELDRAIAVQPALERMLAQDPEARSTQAEAFEALAAALAQLPAETA